MRHLHYDYQLRDCADGGAAACFELKMVGISSLSICVVDALRRVGEKLVRISRFSEAEMKTVNKGLNRLYRICLSDLFFKLIYIDIDI